MNLFGFGESLHAQLAAVGGRDGYIEHVDFTHPPQHAAGTQPGGGSLVEFLKGDVQALGEEADEDMRFDAFVELMKDRPQFKVALERAEAFFDARQVDVVASEFRRVFSGEVAAE